VEFCIGWNSHRPRTLCVNHQAFHRQTPFDNSAKVALASIALHWIISTV
jgi:hypothetical protein